MGSLLDQSMIGEFHLFYSGWMFGNGIPAFSRDDDPILVEDSESGVLLNTETVGNDAYVRRLSQDRVSSLNIDQDKYSELKLDWIKEL